MNILIEIRGETTNDLSSISQYMWTILVINLLIIIAFFFFVGSLFVMHTYFISKNLTTCKRPQNLRFRGVPIMDEDLLHEGLAQKVWLALL